MGLLRDLWLARAGVLSTQVLHEFYVNVTRKIRTPLSKAEARRVVGTYLPWCLAPEAGDVTEAFRIEDEAGIGFWDALIVATAARSGATRVLSEDLNPRQTISGVSVVNPFEASAEAPPPQAESG